MADYDYGHLLEVMLTFHNGFRKSFDQIQFAAPFSQNYTREELESFIQKGLSLANFLNMHHTFEEAKLFPLLAPKMPAFREDEVHVQEHAQMHKKLEAFETYCKSVVSAIQPTTTTTAPEGDTPKGRTAWDTKTYDANHFMKLTEELGSELLPHLDSEEKSLEAENIKRAGFTELELAQLLM